ncbi:MAG: hypothetical protein IKA48_00670 [Fibrobacter sp.]|nr:hypothetical protein [Fibrobacter sp.]
MMTLQKYERCKTTKYLQEARIYRLWDDAVRNINEYWFGIPSVPKATKIVFDLPDPLARMFGKPTYLLQRVACDNALFLKSVPLQGNQV